MTYVAAEDRYDSMPYRRCGRSGVKLPAISLGLWNRFGDDTPIQNQRAIIRRAFDLGITHIDLANNYGPPYGSAERNFGRIFGEDEFEAVLARYAPFQGLAAMYLVAAGWRSGGRWSESAHDLRRR